MNLLSRDRLLFGYHMAVERLQPYLDLGFRGFLFRNPGMMDPDRIALAAETIEAMQAGVPA